jgi:hypothetical protein
LIIFLIHSRISFFRNVRKWKNCVNWIENKKKIENQVKKQQEKKRIQKKQAERTAYEEYAQNKRLSAQDARTRLVAESSSSAKTVTISQAVASYETNFTMAVSVSNKTQ